MVLSQTSHTLLIPSRLPKRKPPSVLLPPASPGCEMMMSLLSCFCCCCCYCCGYFGVFNSVSMYMYITVFFMYMYLPPLLSLLSFHPLFPSSFPSLPPTLLISLPPSFSPSLPPSLPPSLLISLPPSLLPFPAQIIRRYLFTYIPPGFWPRLVARLIAFPKRTLPQYIKVTVYPEHSSS